MRTGRRVDVSNDLTACSLVPPLLASLKRQFSYIHTTRRADVAQLPTWRRRSPTILLTMQEQVISTERLTPPVLDRRSSTSARRDLLTADVWSLGCMLFELALLSPPFPAGTQIDTM